MARLDNTYENYREVSATTLLTLGGKSGLKWVARRSSGSPRCCWVSEQKTFPKLDHFGPDQTGPREVAHAVAAFFLA